MSELSRFEICEAWYVYASLYHRGQGSRLYKVFGQLNRMGFKPAYGFSPSSLPPSVQEYYETLVERKVRQ
jgi:hypothetical protein